MSHNFILFAKSVLKGLCISCQPLISHFVLKQNSIIDSDWLSSRLESNVGIRVLKNPVSIVVVFQHKKNLLKTRDLNGIFITLEYLLVD